MEMKKRDLLKILHAINKVGHIKGGKFAYGICRNKEKIQKEIDLIQKASLKPDGEVLKRLLEYEMKRNDIINQYVKRDEKGEIIKSEEGMRLDERTEKEFREKENLLKEEYKADLDILTEMEEKNKELLDSDIDFNFFKINEANIPEEITPGLLTPLMCLIDYNP